MKQVTIYHNPHCSKSRQTLNLLKEQGIEPKVVEYLKTPLTQASIKSLLKALNIDLAGIIRNNEDIYKELNLAKATEDDLLKAMIKNPVLLQRPIVETGGKAKIGRPPEAVLDLLEQKLEPNHA